MSKKLLVGLLLVLAFSGTYVNAGIVGFDAEGKPIGTFCKVEKVDVCVVAMSEEDCTKLGGQKVDSCPMPEKEEGDQGDQGEPGATRLSGIHVTKNVLASGHKILSTRSLRITSQCPQGQSAIGGGCICHQSSNELTAPRGGTISENQPVNCATINGLQVCDTWACNCTNWTDTGKLIRAEASVVCANIN